MLDTPLFRLRVALALVRIVAVSHLEGKCAAGYSALTICYCSHRQGEEEYAATLINLKDATMFKWNDKAEKSGGEPI